MHFCPAMQQPKLINWVLFVGLSFIWGSSFILMKISKDQLNGIQLGAVRILAAGLIFLPFAIKYIFQVPARKLHLIALTGLFGNLLPAFLFATAIEHKMDSSLAAILNSLTPLFVIVIAISFFKVKISNKKIIGTIIGFIGLFILILSKGVSTDNFQYSMLILLATIMYGLNVNIVSFYLKEIDPIKMAAISLAMMSIPAGIIAAQQNVFSLFRYDEEARYCIYVAALLGIVGSAIATALFYVLIKRAGGLFASLVTYAIPIVGVFWGLLAKEDVTVLQIGCLSLILGGVYLANR
jgi:drug/metabolite transporter (DMT)-like permease